MRDKDVDSFRRTQQRYCLMTGKTVLITGATDGIGKQTALELIRLGATVIVHGRNPDRVRETLNELRTARLVSLASLSRERSGDESPALPRGRERAQ